MANKDPNERMNTEIIDLRSTREIAKMFGVTESYLKKLRHMRTGPRYHKLGRIVKYKPQEVGSWLENALQAVEPEGLV